MQFKYGADPETFLQVGDKFISAHGLFPGTKAEPFKVEKGAVQVDGLALEFNIDPAETASEFSGNIKTVLAQMNEMVKKVDKDMKIVFTPFATFDVKYFKELPDECKILGCDPDYRAADGRMNEPPADLTNRPFRTAAGHYHIGWSEGEDPMRKIHFEDCRFIANHFYERGPEPIRRDPWAISKEESDRLHHYGHSGSFRPKPYGVELRQYSNVWVREEATRLKMFNFIDRNMKALYKG